MALRIKVDADRLRSKVVSWQRDQFPHALALTLNRVANEGQRAIQANMASEFTLRQKRWANQSIKIDNRDRATKARPSVTVALTPPTRSGENLRSDILGKFEPKGTKTKERRRGEGLLAIAVTPSPIRPSRRSIVKTGSGFRPRELDLQPRGRRMVGLHRTFVVPLKGKAKAAIVQRVASGRGGPFLGNPRLRLLYLLQPTAPLTDELRFAETLQRTVATRFRPIFNVALREALATRRSR